jgi:DNA-binding GntR family transcriptional regulator
MSTPLQFERDRAYEGLVDLIMSGALALSEALSERRLAETLDIGRTPVREALRDLVRDGVLEVRPARGTYVRRPDAEDVRELYEVREGLEGLAARLAANKGPTPALSAYGPAFRDMLERPGHYGPEQTYDTGARFHTEIFRAARNRQLMEIYQPLRLRFRLALSLPRLFDHQRVRESVAEHLSILDAIELGDARSARQLMVEHLSRGSEVRGRIFADLADSSWTPRDHSGDDGEAS